MAYEISLAQKVVLLSGADGFFGPYFTEALLRAGATVVAVGRSHPASGQYGEQFADFFKESEKDGHLAVFMVDYYDEEATRKTYEEIIEVHPHIDILINNAFDFSVRTGFNDESGRLENISREQFMAGLESGLWWAVRATQVFGPRMKAQGSGVVINTCSMYASVVPDANLYVGTNQFNPPTYSAAKHGLRAFTRYTASFLGPEVRANSFSPGAIPRFDDSFHGHKQTTDHAPDSILGKLTAKTLSKRLGHPKDLAPTVVFLASDEASGFINGADIPIDGGHTAT